MKFNEGKQAETEEALFLMPQTSRPDLVVHDTHLSHLLLVICLSYSAASSIYAACENTASVLSLDDTDIFKWLHDDTFTLNKMSTLHNRSHISDTKAHLPGHLYH